MLRVTEQNSDGSKNSWTTMAWPSVERGKVRINVNSAVEMLSFHYIYHLQSIQFSPLFKLDKLSKSFLQVHRQILQ